MDTRLLPYSPARDVYSLLGVRPSASTDEIVAACRRLARTFHPDRNRSPRATQEMQVVNVIRHVMTDPELRAEYDVARLRWHAAGRVRPVIVTPRMRVRRRTTSERYARAVWIGVRETLVALAPARCKACRMVIRAEQDAYCAACGTPTLLLTGS